MASSSTSTQLTRARFLLDADRYEDAEAALREALADSPDDDTAHALLALALYHQGRLVAARREAQVAVSLGPNTAFNYYVHALVLLAQQRNETGLRAIREAIRLNPLKASYHAVEGAVYLRRKAWRRALEAAERGLEHDPEHVGCINLRGQALRNLGERAQADATIRDALTQDPENAATHANLGWTLLDGGDHEAAFEHFREALRLDPMSTWARSGIVEAMKARNLIYRGLLRYFLWMSRLTDEEQLEVAGAISVARYTLRAAAQAFFPLYIVVLPLNLLFFAFRILTWTARPLFALVLRFDRFGRRALPKEEIVASNWVAVCLLTAGVSAILGLILREWAFLVPLLAAPAMIVPVSGVFRVPPGAVRIGLAVYTVLLSLTIVATFAFALVGTPWALALALIPAGLFVVGWTSFFWIAALTIIFSR